MVLASELPRQSRKRTGRKTSYSFAPLRLQANSVVSVEAAQAIKNAIAAGRLRPGDRLPPERELAGILGISRSSLRDALKVLTGMGVVRVRRSKGVFVASADDHDTASRRVVGTLLLQRGPVAELFEIREVLETEAARWAATRARADDIERMLAIHANLRDRAAGGNLSPDEANKRDSELHRLIAKATGNSVLVRVMDNLRRLLDQSRDRTAVMPGRMAKSIDEMGRIIDAIRRRDADQAQLEMFAHLKKGEQANVLSAARSARRAHDRESDLPQMYPPDVPIACPKVDG